MLDQIITKIINNGGRPLAVGGFVRDQLLGLQPKDMDIEVHNMPADLLVGLLSEFGKVDTVGVSFGVIKLWTAQGDFDFSLPRRDNKTGAGHKGFQVEVDPTMTIVEAASRRPPLPKGMPASAQLMLEMSQVMGNEVKPILMGRHLIECGVEPGVGMGKMLKAAFEAQLDGEFDDVEAAKVWLFHHILEIAHDAP